MSSLKVENLFGVKGKVALVTGGGTGLGKMMTAALVHNGAKRVYIASRKLKNVEETANEFNANYPGVVVPLQADLISKDQAYDLADQVKEREQRLHILINNSGMSWGAPLEDFPEADGWDKLFALNVKSLFYLTTALLPLLANGADNIDPGRVINVSSVAGTTPVAGGALASKGNGTYSYNVSKAAVNHLTRVLAVSVADKFVTVNAIAPGIFPSKMTAYGIKQAKTQMEKGQPLGRIGTTEDMAGLALFLCSRASSHITGTIVPIDGGATLADSSYARL